MATHWLIDYVHLCLVWCLILACVFKPSVLFYPLSCFVCYLLSYYVSASPCYGIPCLFSLFDKSLRVQLQLDPPISLLLPCLGYTVTEYRTTNMDLAAAFIDLAREGLPLLYSAQFCELAKPRWCHSKFGLEQTIMATRTRLVLCKDPMASSTSPPSKCQCNGPWSLSRINWMKYSELYQSEILTCDTAWN